MGRKVDAIAMDDAGNGQHGVCATPSPRLVERVRDHYGLDTIHETRDLGGASHLNLLIAMGAGCYVARVYRPYVSVERLDTLQVVRRALAQGDVPCATLAPTRDGAPWTVIDEQLVDLERFVAHDRAMDSWERV